MFLFATCFAQSRPTSPDYGARHQTVACRVRIAFWRFELWVAGVKQIFLHYVTFDDASQLVHAIAFQRGRDDHRNVVSYVELAFDGCSLLVAL